MVVVDTVGALVRGCEQIGCPAQVAQREREEHVLVVVVIVLLVATERAFARLDVH